MNGHSILIVHSNHSRWADKVYITSGYGTTKTWRGQSPRQVFVVHFNYTLAHLIL